jgi:hypothetical protein
MYIATGRKEVPIITSKDENSHKKQKGSEMTPLAST